jgi:hypothetical protein
MSETKEAFKSLFVRRALPENSIPPIYPFLMQLQDRVRQHETDLVPVAQTESVGRIVRLAQKRIQSFKVE